MKALFSFILEADVIKLIHVICNILTKQCISLYKLTRNDLQLLANKMHPAGLISSYAQWSHSFDVIIDDFQPGLSFMIDIGCSVKPFNKTRLKRVEVNVE